MNKIKKSRKEEVLQASAFKSPPISFLLRLEKRSSALMHPMAESLIRGRVEDQSWTILRAIINACEENDEEEPGVFRVHMVTVKVSK